MQTNTINPVYRSAIGVALAATGIVLVPLLAMQITDEVAWTLFDFLFAWTLLFGTGLTYKLVSRKMNHTAYRAAVGVAVAAALLLVWINGAVGIIGSENNAANLMYGVVLAIAIIGALIARFRPQGMARTMFAAALAQVLVAVIAVIGGLGEPYSGPAEIIGLNGFFVALWVGSALLFRHAAQEQPPAGEKPEG